MYAQIFANINHQNRILRFNIKLMHFIFCRNNGKQFFFSFVGFFSVISIDHGAHQRCGLANPSFPEQDIMSLVVDRFLCK